MAAVVVVGGGVIGCAVAYRLAQDGHRVTLLERDRVGAHASGAAAGLLAPHTATWASPRLAQMAVRSLELFPELAARLEAETGTGVEFRATPGLAVAADEAELAVLRERHEQLLQTGVAAQLLSGAGLAELEPELAPDLAGGLAVTQAQVSPPRFVTALAWAAARAGAQVWQSAPALAILHRHGVVEGVRTPEGEIEADWVVIAAGPWSPQIGATAGLALDIHPRRGQLVALTPLRRLLTHLVTKGSYYLVPKPDATVVAGSTEEERGFDARATGAGVRGLLAQAERLLPALADAGVARVWAGIRPQPASGRPLVGLAAGFENLVLATGHHREGVLLAPVTAELVGAGLRGSWQPIV